MGYRPQGDHVVWVLVVYVVYEALCQQQHQLAAQLHHLRWLYQSRVGLGRERW